jgi:hypothetical protein
LITTGYWLTNAEVHFPLFPLGKNVQLKAGIFVLGALQVYLQKRRKQKRADISYLVPIQWDHEAIPFCINQF